MEEPPAVPPGGAEADFAADQLRALAALARLELPADRLPELAHRLGGVVRSFAALRAAAAGPATASGPVASPASTPGAGATRPASVAPLPLRPDEPGPVLTTEQALANARRTAADCFLVPRVVEG